LKKKKKKKKTYRHSCASIGSTLGESFLPELVRNLIP